MMQMHQTYVSIPKMKSIPHHPLLPPQDLPQLERDNSSLLQIDNESGL